MQIRQPASPWSIVIGLSVCAWIATSGCATSHVGGSSPPDGDAALARPDGARTEAGALNSRPETADGAGDYRGNEVDGGPSDGSAATVPVPLREALLVYARNNFNADTDEEALTPYLAYVDQQGQVLDPYLFDTFVFLDYELIVSERPTVEEWRRFIDAFFEPAPLPQIARPEAVRGARGALLSGNGQSVAQSGIPVAGGATYAWEVFTRASHQVDGREALLGVIVRDGQSNPVDSGVSGLLWSDHLRQWYQYLPSGDRWRRHRGTFDLPAVAASLDVQILQFSAANEHISVDRVQLVAGEEPLAFARAASAGYTTLVRDGDFATRTPPWTGFVPGDGLERALVPRQRNRGAYQGPVAVSGGSTYTLAAWVRADQESADPEALLGFRIFDPDGNEITSGVSGFAYSTYTRPPMFYRYAQATTTWGTTQATFQLPGQAANLEIHLVNWVGGEVMFDRVQLVAGDTPLSDSDLQSAGYRTLIDDGSAEVWNTGAWRVKTAKTLPSGSGFLPALTSVASSVGDTRKRNVILGLPVGAGFTTQAEFGEVYGRWIDLTQVSNQQVALAWFIDETLSRWNSAPPPGLDLKGFYWMHESREQDAAVAAFVQGRLQSHGLLLTSSPYRAFLVGSSFVPEFAAHFDRVWQQPNVWPPGRWSVSEEVWNNVSGALCAPVTLDEFLNAVGYPPCELAMVDALIDQFQTNCAAISPTAQIHANIEWVAGLESSQGHGRVLDYLNTQGVLDHDYGRFPDRMWYEDAGFGRRCALDPDPVFRSQYDAVYKFITANRVRHGFPAP